MPGQEQDQRQQDERAGDQRRATQHPLTGLGSSADAHRLSLRHRSAAPRVHTGTTTTNRADAAEVMVERRASGGRCGRTPRAAPGTSRRRRARR